MAYHGYGHQGPGQNYGQGYGQGYNPGYNQYGHQQQANWQQSQGAQQPHGQSNQYNPYQGYGAPPQQNPNQELWNWFVAVDRDKSGQITANELQCALMNSNWSQFNPETCRLMIGMFDRDKTGTINFEEFTYLWKYIQEWRHVFDRYDADRSGGIEAAELHKAFSDMGYRLSFNFVQLVLIRFDLQSRRSLKLDDFIQCCVMLKSLTDSFRVRDTNQNGQIQVKYEDFMCMCIENATQ